MTRKAGYEWLLLALVTIAGLPAQSLPLGFTVDVLAPNQVGPIGLDVLPDGRLLFVEQHTGAVKLLVGTTVSTLTTVGDLTVLYSQGLLAIARDSAWPSRPFVYVLHTNATAGDHRISRYTASGSLTDGSSSNLQLAAPYVVLEGIPDATPVNDGACLRFGPDGMLYASFGDDLSGCATQDVTQLHGKIVRLDVAALPATGAGRAPRALLVPPGNPFAGPGDTAPLVWAVGLRNPFRFHVDPLNGDVFVADVGKNQLDEISRVTGGGENLGWPWFEGNLPYTGCAGGSPPNTLAPIAVQTLGPGFTALISLGVYRSTPGAPHAFGLGYEGSYFYVEHFTGRVWRIAADPSAPTGFGPAPRQPGQPSAELWADGLQWIVDSVVAPDGAIYFCERQASTVGSIRRLRPNGAAWAPFGQGCSGTGPAPVLSASGGPQLGQVFATAVTGLQPPAQVAFGVLSLQRDDIFGLPLPLDLAVLGMPGCPALVAPEYLQLLPGANGQATWLLSVPAVQSLSGQAIFVQALVVDPAANAFGATVSNGGEGVIR